MALRASFLCFSLVVLGACTTTATTSTEEAPSSSGPLTIDLALQLTPLNTCPDSANRVQAVAPRGGALVLIQASELLSAKGSSSQADVLLRPPGACGLLSPCGHFSVRIDQATPFVAATRTFEVPLDGLAQPFGPHTLEVQFRGDDESQALDPGGAPIVRTLSIEVVPVDGCPASG